MFWKIVMGQQAAMNVAEVLAMSSREHRIFLSTVDQFSLFAFCLFSSLLWLLGFIVSLF
jgi:hypothetical protein